MSKQESFTREEAEQIFERASRRNAGEHAGETGLTLEELQEIGRGTGINPRDIAIAAAEIRSRPRSGRDASILGVKTGVHYEVDIPRPLDDPEWEILVSELRTTFAARGTIRTLGSMREWSNGNLQVLVERTDRGTRLRMRSTYSQGRTMLSLGAAGIAAILIAAVAAYLGGAGLTNEIIPLFVAAAIAAILALRRIPAWSARRLDQMERVAGRVLEMTDDQPRDATTVQITSANRDPLLDLPDESSAAETESRSRPGRTRS